MTKIETVKSPDTLTFRKPDAGDGSAIWDLVRRCQPLDENSIYCNLLQCDHFRDTCVLVERGGTPVGWISGYVPPSDPDSYFVWQVAVAPEARGLGLGKRMLRHLVTRKGIAGVSSLKTTITASNDASWALFRSFARAMGGTLSSEAHYRSDDHFDGQAATEHMVTISLPAMVRSVA